MNCEVCIATRRPGPPNLAEVGCACVRCLTAVDHDLEELVDLWAGLPGSLEPIRKLGEGRRTPPGPRLPVALEALSLLGPGSRIAGRENGILPPVALLREWATAWALFRTYGTDNPEFITNAEGNVVVPVQGVAGLSRWLRDRLDWAAENTVDFPRFAVEVRVCTASVRRATGLSEVVERVLVGYCPGAVDAGGEGQRPCAAPLRVSAWDIEIRCDSCSAVYPRSGQGWLRLKERLDEEGLAA